MLYIAIPLITAFIGWLTNYVAIQMLFKPKIPIDVSFAGLRLQGLIPKRQKDMAVECADIIEREILQQNVLTDVVKNIELAPLLKGIVSNLVKERLPDIVKTFAPGMVDKITMAAPLIESMIMTELIKEGEHVKEKLSSSVGEKFDIRAIVEDKIANFDLDKLESIIMGVAKKEFKTIEHLGAVLGFFIGIGQVALIHFGGM